MKANEVLNLLRITRPTLTKNGAYQILKKVFPIKWNRGCVLHPVVVNAI